MPKLDQDSETVPAAADAGGGAAPAPPDGRAVLDSLPAAVAVVAPDGRIRLLNRAWADFVAESRAEDARDLIGLDYRDPAFWQTGPGEPNEVAARARQGIAAVLAGGGPFTTEYPSQTAVGEYWLELRAAPLALAEGTGAVLMQLDMTGHKRAGDQAWRRANFDALTGLPNRALLLDRLGQALALARRQGAAAGLVYVDILGLRAFNGDLGHETGDALLRATARHLTAAVRASDTVARVGDDDFVILLPRVGDEAAFAALRAKLAAALGKKIALDAIAVTPAYTIGHLLVPADAAGPEELLAMVEVAAYRGRLDAGRWWRESE